MAYKYSKNSKTGVQDEVVFTEGSTTTWIALDEPTNNRYLEWKEWEAEGNTTEAAD